MKSLWNTWLGLDANLRGIICATKGMLIFTAQDAAIKFLSPDYALHQIIFTRSVVAIVLTVLVA